MYSGGSLDKSFERQTVTEIKKLIETITENYDFICPIISEVFVDPVMTSDGHTYERYAIEKWFKTRISQGLKPTSPKTGLPLDSTNLTPNIALKSLIQDPSQNKVQEKINECLNWVKILDATPSIHFSYLSQQLLRFVLTLSPKHPEAIKLLENSSLSLIQQNIDATFSIFSSSFMAVTPKKMIPDDATLLTMFLNYLNFSLSPDETIIPEEKLFELQNNEKIGIKNITKKMEEWLDCLIEIEYIRGSNDKVTAIEQYTNELHTKIHGLKKNDYCIVPSGFAQFQSWKESWRRYGSKTEQTQTLREGASDKTYTNQHCAAAIIENISENNIPLRKWVQVDPSSPYHQSSRTLFKEKYCVSLEIDKVPLKNITNTLLETMVTMRAIVPKAGHYEYADLYELILAKLNGQTVFKNQEDIFYKSLRENTFGSAWQTVKSTFYCLLVRSMGEQGKVLYKKVLCDFEFSLLLKIFTQYQQATTQELQDEYCYILQEMCSKLSENSVHLNDISHDVLSKHIQEIQSNIEKRIQKNSQYQHNSNEITLTSFTDPTFIKFIQPLSIKDRKFIFQDIKQDITSVESIRKQVFLRFEKNLTSYEKLNEFSQFVDNLTASYGINRVYQLSHSIEKLMLELQSNGLAKWYNDKPEHAEKSAYLLLRFAKLYYSSACRIATEMEAVCYDPSHYAKLVIIMFGIYAMIDVLVRNDECIGEVIKEYKLSTRLNQRLAFENLTEEFVIPDNSWANILVQVKKYFEDQETHKKMLFAHRYVGDDNKCLSPYSNVYHFNISADSNKNNTDIQFGLSLLKEHYPDNFEKLEDQHKNQSLDQLNEKWVNLFYTNDYLPPLVCFLRDISYLSRITLCGFSEKNMSVAKERYKNSEKINYKFPEFIIYKGSSYFGAQVPLYSCGLGIVVHFDPNCFTGYVLPKSQEKFQRLIYSPHASKDNKNIITQFSENEIIASQEDKPSSLTKPQYFTLGFIRSNAHIKFSRIYIALKNHELSFEVEEHCLLIKQALFEVTQTYDQNMFNGSCSLLERRLKNEKFSSLFIGLFNEQALKLQHKVTQYAALGHIIDILLSLHSFCLPQAQEQINICLVTIRKVLCEWTTKKQIDVNTQKDRELVSILNAYCILTYSKTEKFDENDVSTILLSRIGIEQNARVQALLPTDLYIKTVRVLFEKMVLIEDIIKHNTTIVNACIQQGAHVPVIKELFQHVPQNNIFQGNIYALDLVRGRIYKNNAPLSGLPNAIYNHENYQACFGTQLHLLVTMDTPKVSMKTLIRYNSEQPTLEQHHRITLLDDSFKKLWIEQKNKGQPDDDYETFVPKGYFGNALPKVLLDGYTHWWKTGNFISVKNDKHETEFEVQLDLGTVFSKKHKQYVIPFHKAPTDNRALWNTLLAVEDPNYILMLADKLEVKTNLSTIYLPRLKLAFSVHGGAILSDDCKGYQLAKYQHIHTLQGFSQYLVLEPSHENEHSLANNKIIIPNRYIQENRSFCSNAITLGRRDVLTPSYFTYDCDPVLGQLKADTTSGKLYLALLYAKTASLDKDSLTQMNGYETAAELLKNCWQNQPYDDIEHNLILRFLEFKHIDMKKWKEEDLQSKHATESWKIQSRISESVLERKEQHRNSIAIWLRVLYLMTESLDTNFLNTAEAAVKQGISNDNERRHFLNYYFSPYFSYYLSVKDRIHQRCCLSQEEEKKLLLAYQKLNNTLPVMLDAYLNHLITAGQDIQNSAVTLFLDEKALNFQNWYHPEICHYLLQMADNTAKYIRVMFHDANEGNNTKTFKNQLLQLVMLSHCLKNPALFVSKEPGADNHFICGLVKEGNLLLINPLGMSEQDICYQTLAELKQEKTIKEVWISSNALQKKQYEAEGLVSCGPITLELATHILSNFMPEELDIFWENHLKTDGHSTHNASGLTYYGINIDTLLPDTLKGLIKATDKFSYESKVCGIRQKHCGQLQALPIEHTKNLNTTVEDYLSNCKEGGPHQLVFNALITEKTLNDIDGLPAYQLLKQEINTQPTKSILPQKAEVKFISIAGNLTKNYKQLENRFFSDESLRKVGFEAKMKKRLEDYSSTSITNRSEPIDGLFSNLCDRVFKFENFIFLYQTALTLAQVSQPKNKNISQEHFEYAISTLALNTPHSEDYEFKYMCLKLLFLVSLYPDNFKPLPKFLDLQKTGAYYRFGLSYRRIIESDFPDVQEKDDTKKKKIKSQLWAAFSKCYLDVNGFLNVSVAELETFSYLVIKEVIAESGLVLDTAYDPVFGKILTLCLERAKNKEFFDALVGIAAECDKLVNSMGHVNIGKNIIPVENAKCIITNTFPVIANIKPMPYADPANVNDILPVIQWKQSKINEESFHAEAAAFFEMKKVFPESKPFPINIEKFPQESTAREAFSTGYGRFFIDDLEKSYDSRLVAKIDNKEFIFSMKDVDNIYSLLGTTHKEIKTLILSQSSENNIRKMFLNEIIHAFKTGGLHDSLMGDIDKKSEKIYEKWKNLITKRNDDIQSTNSILESQDRIDQQLELRDFLKALREKLELPQYEKLPDETKKLLKDKQKELKKLKNKLEDMSEDIEDICKSEALFKKYLESSLGKEEKLNFNCIKIFVQLKQYRLYQFKLITEQGKLECVEKIDGAQIPKRTIYLLIMNNSQRFYELDVLRINDENNKEYIDENISAPNAELIVPSSYLQTPETHYQLQKPLSELKQFVEKLLQQQIVQMDSLWHELNSAIQITFFSTKNHHLFLLAQWSGKQCFATKMNILQLLEKPGDILKMNPFLSAKSCEEIIQKLQHYLINATCVMKLERTLSLITQHENLDAKIHKEEKDQLLQNIAKTLLIQRSYRYQDHPSWLLFELENNLMIRQTQATLIKTMKEDPQNCMYQLNMGEGKTSVILILLAHLLADGNTLVRVNVLAPLMGVMKGLLSLKWGGLLPKKIYVMPFSRDVNISIDNLTKIKNVLEECRNGQHILLTTPEHRLCFQLKLQEKLLEYVQFKGANNIFDWSKFHAYYNSHGSYNSCPTDNDEKNLKRTLIALRYIDVNDVICKYPDDNAFNQFYDEVYTKNRELHKDYVFGIYGVHHVLRTNSTELKSLVEQQVELLTEIGKIVCCDILDESDEILRHGSELNYTLGSSKPFDGGALRWKVPQYLFSFIFFDKEVQSILEEGKQNGAVIYERNWTPSTDIGGGVPFVRFTNQDFYEEHIKPILTKKLLEKIADEIKEEIALNPESDITRRNHGSYHDFVLGKLFDKLGNDKSTKEQMIVDHLRRTASLKQLNLLLLAKAWLAHDILYYVMSGRYCVEYGLDVKAGELPQKLLAIPYKGKDLPSYRSEFSHPDVLIGLTIMSYLYQGLHLEQIKQALLKLKKYAHQYGNQYLSTWVENSRPWIETVIKLSKNSQFPAWLQSFDTLDLDNIEYLNLVSQFLGRNSGLIGYYLDTIVFPEKAKHYERKISGNAHTLAGEGETKGFSGTDDRNDTMPETVLSKRLPSQRGTNGKMLHILTRPINHRYKSIDFSNSKEFLDLVCKYTLERPDCYSLIDSGALVTGMNNQQAAKYLSAHINEKFKGVIYFDDNTGDIVVFLKNTQQSIPLVTCHLSKSELFVYLDDVHTRGTDLVFPLTAHGIVTLGKGMNKDKLMQAAMRMRQLDFKQSICIWGSKEISANIMQVTGLKDLLDITSEHVLIWTTYNTIQKNSHDLYPVILQKFEYIIKRRALNYQKHNNKIPFETLISRCEDKISDELLTLYTDSPHGQGIKESINIKKSRLVKRFWEDLTEEIDNPKNTIIQTNKSIITFSKDIMYSDKDRDDKEMENISKKVERKLPRTAKICEDLNQDQEKEKELEEAQQAEIPPVEQRVVIIDKPWDFECIFKVDFIKVSLSNNTQSNESIPKLNFLDNCFSNINPKTIEFYKENSSKLKWHSHILATENFITTVNIDCANRKYQDDYLRPADTLLIHKKSGETYCVLLSGFEADGIMQLFDKQQHDDVFLLHLNDIKGAIAYPASAKIEIESSLMQEIIVLIKLFNGECIYNEQIEVPIIKKYLGIIEETSFIQNSVNKDRSALIYGTLKMSGYLQYGFFSATLGDRLIQNQKLLGDALSENETETRQTLNNIVDNSIANDATGLPEFPDNFKKLVELRGKTNEYGESKLQSILKK